MGALQIEYLAMDNPHRDEVTNPVGSAAAVKAAPQTWEYLITTMDGWKRQDQQAWLNARGSEGWELVGFDQIMIFKRPVV